jgi:hypothetical protein
MNLVKKLGTVICVKKRKEKKLGTNLCGGTVTEETEKRRPGGARFGDAICRLCGVQELADVITRQDEAPLLQTVGCRKVEMK